jgi:cell wall-associated NlpC family hydrolase
MTKEQRANANTILQVGQNMGARRKVLVAAIATATVESVLRNLDNAHSDGTSVGLFQQTDNNGYGSREERADPATAARMFFNRCIAKDKEEPHVPTGQLCQDVQGSNFPNAYATRVEEASRTVAAFGVPQNKGDDSTEGSAADANNMAATSNWSPGGDNAYYYYRGIPPKNGSGNQWKREDNWTCIRRLADEVDWRAFFISGTFYYLTDDDLYKMQPSATITESTKGVLGIGFDYDLGKKGATVDIPAMVGLWLAPPGAIIVLQQMGPLDGRWLVNSFSRSLFSSNADINLAKPTPKLPEPADANVQQNDMPTWQSGQDTTAWAPTQNGPLLQDGSRNAIVGAASRALQIENAGSHYHYEQSRPYPQSLFSQAAHDKIDCSAFATLVFKEAGLPDPNGSNYDGNGNTSSLIAHGVPVSSPAPGDLIFYREPASYPGHVGVYVGGGDIIEIGGPDGIKRMSWQYGDPVVGIRRYANR